MVLWLTLVVTNQSSGCRALLDGHTRIYAMPFTESPDGRAEASHNAIWLYDHRYVNYLVNFTSDLVNYLINYFDTFIII